MRRLLGTLGGIALALGLVAGPVVAQDSGTGDWQGTKLSSEPASTGAQLRVDISWTRPSRNLPPDNFLVTLSIAEPVRSQETCPAPHFASAPPPPDGDPSAPPQPFTTRVPAERPDPNQNTYTAALTEALITACNGRFDVVAVIHREPPGLATPSTTLRRKITVANSAGVPRELGADRIDDGRVRLGWKAPAQPKPHDFLGYAVDRVDEDGTVTRLATSTTKTGLTDATAEPDEALEYRVVTLREGPGGPGTPPVESDPATVEVEGTPEPEPSTTTSEADSVEASGGETQGGGSGAPQVSRPRTGTSRPRVGPAPTVTPTTIDTGFDEDLPFDPDRMVGPRDAVVPEDEFASLIFDEPEGGAGLAVPGATAAVLAVWAMHLHHLNRLARQDP